MSPHTLSCDEDQAGKNRVRVYRTLQWGQTTPSHTRATAPPKEQHVLSGSVMCNFLWPPCSLPGYPAHGISQARILERVAISFSKEAIVHNHNPELQTPSPLLSTISSHLRGESLTWALWIEFRNLDNYCSLTYIFWGVRSTAFRKRAW